MALAIHWIWAHRTPEMGPQSPPLTGSGYGLRVTMQPLDDGTLTLRWTSLAGERSHNSAAPPPDWPPVAGHRSRLLARVGWRPKREERKWCARVLGEPANTGFWSPEKLSSLSIWDERSSLPWTEFGPSGWSLFQPRPWTWSIKISWAGPDRIWPNRLISVKVFC
jgi:hypothetical protein